MRNLQREFLVDVAASLGDVELLAAAALLGVARSGENVSLLGND